MLLRKKEFRSFEGKVALITGADSGIGRALATRLAVAGAKVEASDLAGSTTLTGVRFSQVDVTDRAAVERWIEDAARRHGRIDFLVNNAGIAIGGEAHALGDQDWSRCMDVLLNGVIYGVRAAYPMMVKQGFGHIVNVSSIAGLSPCPLALPYTTAKHAVVGLSTALRAEAAGKGVRVSVVCPGGVQTEIWDRSVLRGVERGSLALIPKFKTADECAREILAGVERNRDVIVVTPEAKALWALSRLSPPLAGRLARVAVAIHRRKHPEGRFTEANHGVP